MRALAFALLLLGCNRHITLEVTDGGSDALPSRAQAALTAATTDPACTALGPFYWEIGDAGGPLASGSVGDVTASSAMDIASASKLIFGAYIVERFGANLAQADFDAMTMRSGYHSLVYATCVASATVQDCLAAAHNGDHTAADDGRFYYNGGHFQKYAVDLGLGADDDAALAAEMKRLLGEELEITYGSPQLAAGMHVSPAGYAGFLRKILSGGLAIRDHLGENATCTLPSACPTATSSPSPEAWHYSWGHWVEDDPTTGDGTFSSPGAFGFYPWIDATKQYYGILARRSLAAGAYYESVQCGRIIRQQFLSE